MIAFLDSSAIVKRYAYEDRHQFVRALADPNIVSTLARVEVAASIWRN